MLCPIEPRSGLCRPPTASRELWACSASIRPTETFGSQVLGRVVGVEVVMAVVYHSIHEIPLFMSQSKTRTEEVKTAFELLSHS